MFLRKIHYNKSVFKKKHTIIKCVFKKKDLYPLKKYKFGEYKVLGPNNPKGYLDGCYGKDWNEVKYQEWDHQKEEEKFKQKVPLNKRDRQPAQPTGPIKK